MDKYIETPLTKDKVKDLRAGDYVYITGINIRQGMPLTSA